MPAKERERATVANRDAEFLRAAILGYQLQMADIESRIAEVRRRLAPPKRVAKPKESEPRRRGRWPDGARAWSSAEIKRLRKLYPRHSQQETAALLGRTRSSVASKAKVLGLGERRFWTPTELSVVREMYADHSTEEIAAKLGRTARSVYQAADKMGLRKTQEFRKTCGFQKGHRHGVEFRFKKGQVPKNKGVRRPGWAAGRMRETQFKKGERRGLAAQNWRPIGTVLPDTEGFLRIKVREPLPGEAFGWGNKNAWAYVHHLVWQEHHGPIPDKHVVAFKDGKRANCAIENLECIPRAELARRNSMWSRYPHELAELIQLTGVLKRKLREASRG